MSVSNADNSASIRGDVIEVKLSEHQTPEDLMQLRERIIELSGGREYDVIVDVREPRIGTPETRAAAERFFVDLPYKRFAIWGGSPPVNLSIKSLVEAQSQAGSRRVRIFRREVDARAWFSEPEK